MDIAPDAFMPEYVIKKSCIPILSGKDYENLQNLIPKLQNSLNYHI